MNPPGLARALFLGPLRQGKGRLALAIAAIALGVALGYAVQLVNQSAIGEFAHTVQTLAGAADLELRGPRAGFDEALYPQLARMPEVAVASPVIEVDVRVVGRDATLRLVGLDVFRGGAPAARSLHHVAGRLARCAPSRHDLPQSGRGGVAEGEGG